MNTSLSDAASISTIAEIQAELLNVTIQLADLSKVIDQIPTEHNSATEDHLLAISSLLNSIGKSFLKAKGHVQALPTSITDSDSKNILLALTGAYDHLHFPFHRMVIRRHAFEGVNVKASVLRDFEYVKEAINAFTTDFIDSAPVSVLSDAKHRQMALSTIFAKFYTRF